MSKSLSILLPTYNCICTALVGELQRQCVAEGADFEIIVADDASPDKRFITENRAIARLDGVRYIERERNVGRSSAIILSRNRRKNGFYSSTATFRSTMPNSYTTICKPKATS